MHALGESSALEVSDSAALDVLAGVKKFEAGPIATIGAALWVAYKLGQRSAGKPTGIGAMLSSFLAFKAMNLVWTGVLTPPAASSTEGK